MDKQLISTTIKPTNKLLNINLKEIWQFRDLVFMFVKRDLISIYKQTLLGPLWFLIQPLFTTLTFLIIFDKLAGIETGAMPSVLFYLLGISCWNYYAESLNKTSNTFIENQQIFGKVYFPRLVVPISVIISGILKFFIQFFLFILVYIFYVIYFDTPFKSNATVLFFPLYLIIMAGLGLGWGVIISSLTTKYRDLKFLLQFGIQLLMYATPVIYPISTIPAEKIIPILGVVNPQKIMLLSNPISIIIESMKYSFIGEGFFNVYYLLYAFSYCIFLMFIGMLIFNKVERNFMDHV